MGQNRVPGCRNYSRQRHVRSTVMFGCSIERTEAAARFKEKFAVTFKDL